MTPLSMSSPVVGTTRSLTTGITYAAGSVVAKFGVMVPSWFRVAALTAAVIDSGVAVTYSPPGLRIFTVDRPYRAA
jgi:hypothetical protein